MNDEDDFEKIMDEINECSQDIDAGYDQMDRFIIDYRVLGQTI